MPFQNAPAIVACGAKICRDESIVVRYNKKSGENLLMWMENIGFFMNSWKGRNRMITCLGLPFLFCCYQDFEPCKPFQWADFHSFKPGIFA
jgi:hypothetical protein